MVLLALHGVTSTKKESSSSRASFYFTRFFRCRLSIPSAGICKRGRGAFVKSQYRKELDEDASHVLHTKAVGEKIFRRRTGNDETNFAGSVWAQIGLSTA